MCRITGIPVLICLMFFLYPSSSGHTDPAKGEAKCQCPCPCPAERASEPSPDSDRCPETLLLDEGMEVYEAVSFSHRDHAELAEEGCASCHHHTPVGVYKKCGQCHRKGLFESDKLNLLNLKAAYHRQCIECHVEWEGGPTDCTECHEMREEVAGRTEGP